MGTDDDGRPVRMRMKDFWRYATDPAHGSVDDSPLYIFDSAFAARGRAAGLGSDYEPPAPFSDDLLAHAPRSRRPPFRWLVAGPARSGSAPHLDPLATSAWNALLAGAKLWALFPPGTPKACVAPRGGGAREAVSWFGDTLPHALADPAWPGPRPLTALQRAGETMYVPGQWWHGVLNLETTVAVTHNFCSPADLPRVWPRAMVGRPKMAAAWLAALEEARPEAAAAARAAGTAGGDGGSAAGSGPSSSSSSSSSSSESDGDAATSSSESEASSVDSRDAADARRDRRRRVDAAREAAKEGNGA